MFLISWMGESAAPIPACGGCWAAPLPVKKPVADLSAYAQLQLAYEDNAHRNSLPYAGIKSCP